jgi:hypothetical protein
MNEQNHSLCFSASTLGVGKQPFVVDEGVREPSEFGSAVNGVFVREVPLAVAAWASSFGTILCGLETMRSAWPTLEYIFSVRVGSSAQGAAAVSEPGLVFSGSRYPLGLLKANPVDLLVIERGALVKPSSLSHPERWEAIVDATPVSSRSKMTVAHSLSPRAFPPKTRFRGGAAWRCPRFGTS